MPRDGSGIYSKPVGTTAVTSTTIESAKYNAAVDDFVTDANTPRPIVAGGTGASSVSAAQTALKIPPFDGVATVSGAWTISGAWTYTGNALFNNSVTLGFGTTVGTRTTIAHNGTNAIITDASAGLIAKTASFKVQNAAGTEDMIEAVQDSFVKLSYNNTARLTTTATGVTIAGDLAGDTISGAMVSTSIAADTGSTTKVPRVAAVEAYVAANSKILTLATRVTASGTTVDFTGIPAGVKEIVIMFDGVSLSGTDNILVQLGDAGGFEATGYISNSGDSASQGASTVGFIVRNTVATDTPTGSMLLHLMNAATFQWVQQHGLYRSNASAIAGGGSKSLSAELTQVRITTDGTNTFDAGTINIAYR